MNHLASGPGKVTYIQTRLEISRQWKCRYFNISTNNQLQKEVDITFKGVDDSVWKIYYISSATRGTVDKLEAIIKQLQLRLKEHNRVVREKKVIQKVSGQVHESEEQAQGSGA